MKWDDLLTTVDKEPVFSSGLLLTRGVDPADLRKQLSRWVASSKLIQLRRGLYALAEPYRKVEPAMFLVANQLNRPSYVSLQSALAFHGHIPEYVPAVTSITTGRPEELSNQLGRFIFRHCKPALFFGYQEQEVGPNQRAFVALPEKALLDLVHLTPKGDSLGFLTELRLQDLDRFDLDLLRDLAAQAQSPKLVRAAKRIAKLAEGEEFEAL